MKKFWTGLVLGLLLGIIGSTFAAKILGSDGYLIDWTVTTDGESICDAPYIWTSTKEIECD